MRTCCGKIQLLAAITAEICIEEVFSRAVGAIQREAVSAVIAELSGFRVGGLTIGAVHFGSDTSVSSAIGGLCIHDGANAGQGQEGLKHLIIPHPVGDETNGILSLGQEGNILSLIMR